LIRISKLTDYASIVAVGLAKQPELSQSASEISTQLNLAYPTVSKVLKMLNEAGLVKSLRGALGGYSLARSANSITLADLIDAIEGVPGLTECSRHECECVHQKQCGLKHNWSVINTSMNMLLRSVTLGQMCDSLDIHTVGAHFMTLLHQNNIACEEV
jgi:FeS assembly SUF system regulator